MQESDTVYDTETGAKSEVRAPTEVGAREQAEMPIGDGFQEKEAGGVPSKNQPLPSQLVRLIQNFLTKGDVSGSMETCGYTRGRFRKPRPGDDSLRNPSETHG